MAQNKMFKILLLVVILGLIGLGCLPGVQLRGWSGPVVADGTLFLGSMEGKLVAINIADGTYQQWSLGTAIYGTPAVGEELVYVGGYNGIIYAITRDQGVLRRFYPPVGNLEPIVGGAVVALGKVYIGSSDGRIYALDADTGDKKWDFETGDKIWSTPAIAGDTLYIGSFDKKLYALNAIDGSKRWEFNAEGAIASTPLVYNNTVYVGSIDRHLYAVNAADGSLKWKFQAGNWFWAKPVVHNNTIYAGNLDGKVYILNAETGKQKVDPIDLMSPIFSSPVLVDDWLIIASEEGKIYALDTSNNQIEQIADLGEKIYAPLYASEGKVYVHTEKGTLHEVSVPAGATRQVYSIKR